MKTLNMLLAHYDFSPMVAAETICKDYFAPLSYDMFMRKLGSGEIAIPLVKMDSQKGAKMIALVDLAAYMDAKAEDARKELRKLAS